MGVMYKPGSACTYAHVQIPPRTHTHECVCTCAPATIMPVRACISPARMPTPELVYPAVCTRVCKIPLLVCAPATHLCVRVSLEDMPLCVSLCVRARAPLRKWLAVCVCGGRPGAGGALGQARARVGGGSGGAARGGRALGGELEELPSRVLVAAGRGAGCAPSFCLQPPPRPPFLSPRLPRGLAAATASLGTVAGGEGLARPERAGRRGAPGRRGERARPCPGSDNSRRGRGWAGRAPSRTEGRTPAAPARASAPRPGAPSRRAPPTRG